MDFVAIYYSLPISLSLKEMKLLSSVPALKIEELLLYKGNHFVSILYLLYILSFNFFLALIKTSPLKLAFSAVLSK